MSPETAPPKPKVSVFATSASNPVTSRQPAPTKHAKNKRAFIGVVVREMEEKLCFLSFPFSQRAGLQNFFPIAHLEG